MLEFQEHVHEAGVPVVRMDDVGPEVEDGQQVQHGAAEEGEPLRIVPVAVEALAVEILLVVDEVVRHIAELVRIEADVFLTPRHGQRAIVDMLHRVPILLGDLAVFRHDDPDIHAVSLERLRQGASHVGETSCLRKWYGLSCYV